MKKEVKLILDSTHDAMIAVDRDGIITLFNRAACLLTKKRHEEVIGRPITEVVESTRLPIILETGESELNQYQPLGDISIITNRMPVKNEEGEVIGAIAVFRDITEIKELAAKITDLNEVKAMLEAVINSTSDAISVVDKDGKGLVINPAYTKITGYTKKDIIGKPCTVDIAVGESVHLQVLEKKKPVMGVRLKTGPNRKEIIVDASPMIVDGELIGSVAVIHDLTEINRLLTELDQAKKIIRTLEAKYTFEDIIGSHGEMQTSIEKAKLAAVTPATVILRGESGTGKELFAHAIHNASSRKNSQFVRVNCAAISQSILESELFGYEEGAFTGAMKGGKIGLFERADGGTLFLDEIGEINMNTQAKLLRVLQEKEVVKVGGTKPIPVDVRIISATNLDLEKAVEDKTFREDLYYRLNVVPIKIPPLREHKEDLRELIDLLINRFNQEYGRNVTGISDEAFEMMYNHDWPGNVRELENFIGRSIINMAFNERIILMKHLPETTMRYTDSIKHAEVSHEVHLMERKNLAEVIEEAERRHIKSILEINDYNREKAAQDLGVSVRTLYYKIKKLNIE